MQRAAAIGGLILLLLAAAPARAQSPEQAYIAERSAAAAKVEATKGDALDKGLAEAQRASNRSSGPSSARWFHRRASRAPVNSSPSRCVASSGADALDGMSFGNGRAARWS